MSEIKTNKISPRKGTTQTIGDSGDTVSIACGATVTNAGTISTAGISGGTINNTTGTITGLQGVIEWDTTAKTTAFTAESNKGYFVNTTSGAITVTFPASPTAGDVIGIKDYANTADTNIITINPNGNNINGSSNDYLINIEGASGEFIYVDATRGWVLTDASKASDIAEAATFITATGGTVTCCGDYKIHTFTGPGTFCVSAGSGPLAVVDYLVVAGGGGGASVDGTNGGAGGGGAGGYRESYCSTTSGCYTASPLAASTSIPVSITAYPITVGGGGATGPASTKAVDGSDSIFSTITSTGGGGGGSGRPPAGTAGGNGGSGGGSTWLFPTGGFGSGNTPPVSPPQGNDGGSSSNSFPGIGSGGGGGALVVGGNGTSTTGGPGGNGATTSISGSPTAYSGGGGGSVYSPPSTAGPGSGTGGTGGGGDARSYNPGIAGTANTGGGGGAGGNGPSGCQTQPGGAGGSGVVIIRYKYQ